MKKQIRPFVISTLAIAAFALGVDLFSWQFKLVSGGMPGYSLVLNYLTGISVGTSLLIINTIIFIFAFLILGKTAGVRGVYGYCVFSFFVDFFKNILHLTQTPIMGTTGLMMMALQGLLTPVAVSLVILNSYSLGNYSTIYPIINHYKKISAPVLFFAFDFILSIFTLFFFGVERSLLLLFNSAVFFLSFKYSLAFLGKKYATKI